MLLEIKNLKASVEGKPILKGLDFSLEKGQTHAIMGPNGSGKSTLANVLMGNPEYTVTDGSILWNGRDLLEMEPHERALAGLFLSYQYPVEIPGLTVGKFLKRAAESRLGGEEKLNVSAYLKEIRESMDFLEMDRKFINRYLNTGFSGGEKKRMEILQMLLFKPRLAILDETDSGLDIDALRVVSRGVNKLRNPLFSSIIITHYQRILDYVKPDRVHVLYDGKIVESGGPELVGELEKKGYEWIKRQNPREVDHEQSVHSA
ncbi:MAG: Fe-S cluster assembly ATPase SufC [Spirochaetales bacterium]|nr:Fe-S cluster assembly ATPase SufC [Spirochaetales bacterium]